MKRREFITLVGGAAAAWPLATRAQQPQRVRRIGVFMPGTADDPEYQARNAAFLQGLGELGWIVGRNVRIDYRWGAGDVDRYRAIATELVALAPDAIVALGYAAVSALQKATRSVPIVFTNVIDPVGGSLVASLARPGGNTTGFSNPECGFAAKWLELLKEIAPGVMRVAVLCGIRGSPPRSRCSAASSRWRHRSGSSRARSIPAMPATSSALSSHSPASRTAA